jgi:hypothetical protein
MNIYKQLKSVYSVRAVERSAVKHWPSWFADSKRGHAELSDAHHPGQPTTALTQILLQSAKELIWNNGRIRNIKDYNWALNIQGNCENITDSLGPSKVSACWVTWSLTNYHKPV